MNFDFKVSLSTSFLAVLLENLHAYCSFLR